MLQTFKRGRNIGKKSILKYVKNRWRGEGKRHTYQSQTPTKIVAIAGIFVRVELNTEQCVTFAPST
jgi:hypothetical protein